MTQQSAPPPPAVLLYDWDNTLVDGWAAIVAALNTTFSAHGLSVWTVEQARAGLRRSLRDSFPGIFGDAWRAARELFHCALTEYHLTALAPMPGAVELLDAGVRFPQGVVSNKSGGFLRAEVAHLGWQHHFRAVVGAGDAAADKPDAAPIRLALAPIGAGADRSVWYIGDTALDMQTARAADCTAVLLGDAAHDGGIDRAAPDLQFDHARLLADYLRSVA